MDYNFGKRAKYFTFWLLCAHECIQNLFKAKCVHFATLIHYIKVTLVCDDPPLWIITENFYKGSNRNYWKHVTVAAQDKYSIQLNLCAHHETFLYWICSPNPTLPNQARGRRQILSQSIRCGNTWWQQWNGRAGSSEAWIHQSRPYSGKLLSLWASTRT